MKGDHCKGGPLGAVMERDSGILRVCLGWLDAVGGRLGRKILVLLKMNKKKFKSFTIFNKYLL